MTPNPTAAAWATTRGEKWRAQYTGMEATLSPLDAPLIDALRLDAPYRIAEVGSGSGGTTLEILRRAPAGSVVHGFDISPALVEVARGRKPSEDAAISFELADMSTASPDEPYDRLVSRLGIMFFDDQPAAFSNLLRWLKPGGRFAFAAWGATAANPWLTIIRQVVAQVIEIPPMDPDAPGPFRFADAQRLLALLDRAGFAEVEVNDWHGVLALGGGLPAAEAANFGIVSFSSFAEVLTQAGGDALPTAHRLLTERLVREERDGVVQMDASVHIFTGKRPIY